MANVVIKPVSSETDNSLMARALRNEIDGTEWTELPGEVDTEGNTKKIHHLKPRRLEVRFPRLRVKDILKAREEEAKKGTQT